MAKPSRKQIMDDLLDSALGFIQRNPPAGFNVAYFTICLMSGRVDTATEYLKGFGPAHGETKEAANA